MNSTHALLHCISFLLTLLCAIPSVTGAVNILNRVLIIHKVYYKVMFIYFVKKKSKNTKQMQQKEEKKKEKITKHPTPPKKLNKQKKHKREKKQESLFLEKGDSFQPWMVRNSIYSVEINLFFENGNFILKEILFGLNFVLFSYV